MMGTILLMLTHFTKVLFFVLLQESIAYAGVKWG